MSLKSELQKYNIHPTKKLGQNFLVSEKALIDIVNSANVNINDRILEIGPGTGLLTEKILARGAFVLAIEKDKNLTSLLEDKLKKYLASGQLEVINADVLKIPFKETLIKRQFEEKKYKVISNLPYQITSPFLERILERNFLPASVTLTLQKEVAKKICAPRGKLNSLSVMVQMCAKDCKVAKQLSKNLFYPRPKIDSAVISIVKPSYPPGVNIKTARLLIRAGFSEKRKKLKNNFKKVFSASEIEKIWKKLNLSENIRAEELEVEKWIILIRKKSKSQIPNLKPKHQIKF